MQSPAPWWTTVSAMARPPLKTRGRTLRDVIADLDRLQANGFDAVEIFAPCEGGVCYDGLDTLDYYRIDPAIGTMADFEELVARAHERGMRVVAFLNLGYGHEAFPAFLKACDDVREGRESPETRMFLWSETGADSMERPLAPYFLNDAHGNWRWSEWAQKYFWVKWEGEQGGRHLPQFNWGDPGWQVEARRILTFWRGMGIDGVVIDAVNWYIDCDWEIARRAMTDVLNAGERLFSQPEGAGGFDDDPVPWITAGGFTCVMDYALKIWWEGVDVVRDAVIAGDPRPIEEALRAYRDRVVAAGGVCYINTADLDDAPVAQRLLAAATIATAGELFLEIGDGADWDDTYRVGVRHLLEARRCYPALSAGGTRTVLRTSDDARFYAFLREAESDGAVMLVVLNFGSAGADVAIDLGERLVRLRDIHTGECQIATGEGAVRLPGYGYAMYEVQPETEAKGPDLARARDGEMMKPAR